MIFHKLILDGISNYLLAGYFWGGDTIIKGSLGLISNFFVMFVSLSI
jgi:hypothetical protein